MDTSDSASVRIRPLVFTRHVVAWRDLLTTIGLNEVPGDDGRFAAYEGGAGSLFVHALEGTGLPEGAVKLAWEVPDLVSYREDVDAAGFTTELIPQNFGDELHIEVPDLGWVAVTEGQRVAPSGTTGGSISVGARVGALDADEAVSAFRALGWAERFAATDGSYVSLSGDGLLAVARGTRLPTLGDDAGAVLTLEVDTPRTEYERLGDLGLDVGLVEQSWGLAIEVATPSDWVLRLIQPPLDDPAYSYADPVEQEAADEVADPLE